MSGHLPTFGFYVKLFLLTFNSVPASKNANQLLYRDIAGFGMKLGK